MIRPEHEKSALPSAVLRLSRLAPLPPSDVAMLNAAVASRQIVRPRHELASEGRQVLGPRLIVSGWAARVRLLADGRRQLISFLIPGDLIGLCRQPQPLAVSTIITLSELSFCAAPLPTEQSRLGEAYAISQALEEAYLLAHIVRLGRLNAQERIADLLLELYERQSLAGLVHRQGFEFPLTQEVLADALGLTSVHVNRTVQAIRQTGDIEWKGRKITLRDPAALAQKLGRAPTRVTAQQPA